VTVLTQRMQEELVRRNYAGKWRIRGDNGGSLVAVAGGDDLIEKVRGLLIEREGLNLKPEQSNIFFKLMEERYRHHSTIITTNLGYDEWPNFLGNRPIVEALLSRLRHYCHTVPIDGPSLREPQG
jgi:hypothetical protein